MKRILLPAALVLALSTGLAFAQEPTAPPAAKHAHSPAKEAAKMSKELNLTSDQTAKLEPILAAREEKLSALKANTALAPEDMKKQMHAIQKDTQQQLSVILTPDQLQQVKSMKKHHGKHGDTETPTAPPAA